MIYRLAVEGINKGMHTEIEEAFQNTDIFQCFVAEALLQAMTAGKYLDPSEVRNSSFNTHFKQILLEACDKSGIR